MRRPIFRNQNRNPGRKAHCLETSGCGHGVGLLSVNFSNLPYSIDLSCKCQGKSGCFQKIARFFMLYLMLPGIMVIFMRVKLLCLRRVLFCDLFDRVIKEAYNDNINHTEICKTERGQENRPLVPQSANPEIPKCQFGTLD